MPCGKFVAGTAGAMGADRSPSGRWCWTGRQLGESEEGCLGGSLAWTWLGFGCVSARVAGSSGGGATWWVKQQASRRGNGRHACWEVEDGETGWDADPEMVSGDVWIWRIMSRHAPSLRGSRRDRSGQSVASRGNGCRSLSRDDGEGLEWAGLTRQRG